MSMFSSQVYFDKKIGITILILITLCGQLFNYYTDTFIWKFSDSEIRKSIGNRLFAD